MTTQHIDPEAGPARLWIIPLLLYLLVMAPLLRDGLPATQAGMFPLGTRLVLDTTAYKGLIALATALLALLSAAAGRAWWGPGRGWWIASLWLLLPGTIAAIYQRGGLLPQIMLGALLLAAWGVGRAAGGWRPGVAALLGGGAVALWAGTALPGGAGLDPVQLFANAWPAPTSGREWLAAPSYQVGLVVTTLTLALLLRAADRTVHPAGRRSVALAGVASLCALASLIGGPVVLFVAAASVALLLAAAALPVLDARFSEHAVLIMIVAAAAFLSYPALRPAWIDGVVERPLIAFAGADGSQVRLLSARAIETSQGVSVAARWELVAPPSGEISAFVHLLDPAGERIGQADRLLLDEENVPIPQWPVGYVVTQRYLAEGVEGAVTVRIGLYESATGSRLATGAEARLPDAIDLPIGARP